MFFSAKVLIFIFIFASFIFSQEISRSQKVEELRKLDSQIEQIQDQLGKMEERKDEMTKDLLAVNNKDNEEAAKIGAKATRLFPDKILDDFVDFPDNQGASVYSFIEVADYYFAPRLEYKNNSLEFVRGEKYSIYFQYSGRVSSNKM